MIRHDDAVAGAAASALSLLALAWVASHHELLLYGDAVAHLHIARRVLDTDTPSLANFGSVWLPLPHLLMIPFVMVDRWWQSGLAGAIPSMISYVAAVIAMFRLGRLWLPLRWAALAAAVFACNPALLYMQTTAMTEPLFLALFLWALVWTSDFLRSADDQQPRGAASALIKLGIVLAAAVMTRYDGWILTACIGLLVAARWRFVLRGPRGLRIAAAIFTVMVIAAPLAWLWFNARYFHDPLDFLRGPYSASAIEARTAVPGHAPHPGYHRPWIALRYYLRAATFGAARGSVGNAVVLLLAAIGTVALLLRRAETRSIAWLLWFPLAFYTYSVAYGSVPIFMPIWPPFAFYNTRYGMELLPALALFPIATLHLFVRSRANPVRERRWLIAASMAAACNAVLLAAATPIVLQEARVNSATRIPYEQQLAAAIAQVRPAQRLLMYGSAYAGALQVAGRPLRDTIMETDYYKWPQALADPAGRADFILATDGDPVAAAVAAHPDAMEQRAVITCQGQPRAILYRSRKSAAP